MPDDDEDHTVQDTSDINGLTLARSRYFKADTLSRFCFTLPGPGTFAWCELRTEIMEGMGGLEDTVSGGHKIRSYKFEV